MAAEQTVLIKQMGSSALLRNTFVISMTTTRRAETHVELVTEFSTHKGTLQVIDHSRGWATKGWAQDRYVILMYSSPLMAHMGTHTHGCNGMQWLRRRCQHIQHRPTWHVNKGFITFRFLWAPLNSPFSVHGNIFWAVNINRTCLTVKCRDQCLCSYRKHDF